MSLSHGNPVSLPERPNRAVARSLVVICYSLLTALMIITPLLVFVPAALLHCGIRSGRRAAWAVLVLSGAIAAVLLAVPAGAPPMVWSYLATVVFALGLPAMLALPMVERGEKYGQVAVFLLIASVAGLVATEIASRLLIDHSPLGRHLEQAEQFTAEWMQFYRDAGVPAESMGRLRWLLRAMMYVLPAMVIIQMAMSFILSLLMLGRLKAWHERAARLGQQTAGTYLFRNFSLPEWLLFVFVLGGLTPMVTGVLQQVGANMIAIVAFLYILQGVAVFRYLLTAVGASGCGTLFAGTLLFVFAVAGPGTLLLLLAGLFDPFFDFRRFKKRKDNSDGNESHSD